MADHKLIHLLFPNLNWKSVNIKYGMPWFLRNSFAAAVVLPNTFSRKKIYMHLRHKSDENNLSLIFHEAVHVLQHQHLDKQWPYSFGYIRSFMWHYLAWSIALFLKGIFKEKLKLKKALEFAYNNHPMEIEAYKKEAIFWDAYKLNGENLSPIIFIQLYPGLITTKCDYIQKPPRFAFVISIILSILIQILKPLLDIFMLISDLIWAIFRKNTK